MNALDTILKATHLRKPRITLRLSEGVVTPSDAEGFIGLQLLYCSVVMRHECRVAVIDLGLTPEQKEWCRLQRDLFLVTPAGKRTYSRLYKPYYLTMSPFSKSLWLDPNTIVLGNLATAFDIIEDEPLIVRSYTDLSSASRFFDAMSGQVPVPQDACYPLSGVVGINRHTDQWLLRDWILAAELVMMDEKRGAKCPRLDEGCLAWALAKNGKIDLPTSNPAWNWLVHGGVDEIKSLCYDSAAEFLVGVEYDFPNASILNFGWPPPWVSWPDHVLPLMPHLAGAG